MAAKQVKRFALLLSFTGLWITLQLVFHDSKVTYTVEYSDPCQDPNDSGCKKILLWNNAQRIEAASFGLGRDPFVRHRCPVADCFISNNRSEFQFDQLDAVVISAQDLWATRLPPQRNSGQRFIFFTQESPAAVSIRTSQFRNYFNWTMTYRLDSDIRLLYGRITPLDEVARWSADEIRAKIRQSRSGINYAANKTKSVAWMASHCPTASQREVYVDELQQHTDVDVYGMCGNFSCQRDSRNWLSHPSCYDMIERRYKFYLSFENAICDDYVTEKFYNILTRNVVPIVFGGAEYQLIAPPHSYIDAMKYTPAELARYLRLLDADDELYNEYFWWKPYYSVESGVQQLSRHAFCDLCAKLHSGADDVSLIDDWSVDHQCRSHQTVVTNHKKSNLLRFTLKGFPGFQ